MVSFKSSIFQLFHDVKFFLLCLILFLKNPRNRFSTYAQIIGCNKKSMRPRRKKWIFVYFEYIPVESPSSESILTQSQQRSTAGTAGTRRREGGFTFKSI